jgi:hypothetical protein
MFREHNIERIVLLAEGQIVADVSTFDDEGVSRG